MGTGWGWTPGVGQRPTGKGVKPRGIKERGAGGEVSASVRGGVEPKPCDACGQTGEGGADILV